MGKIDTDLELRPCRRHKGTSEVNKNEMSFKTFGANDYNETFRNASIFSQKNRCRAMLQRLAG